MKNYRNASQPLDFKKFQTSFEGEKSQTIPDQAISTREILARYTTGQSLSLTANTPVYAENAPLYDTRRKSNIDIAVDRLNNEQKILEKESRVYDNKTKLSKLDKLEKAQRQFDIDKQQAEQSEA